MNNEKKERMYRPVTTFVWGPPGSGKTSFITELFRDELYNKPKKAKSGFDYWTGYDGQDVVLIDEFDEKINWLSLSSLLNDNKANIEIEPNKFVSFNAKYIFIINTNLLEEETYVYRFLYDHLTYIIEFRGKWNGDIEKRTTELVFHKGDEKKFHNMEWDIEYRKENINNINTVKIQNQKIDGIIVYSNDGKVYFRQEFPEYIKKYLLDYPKSKSLSEYKDEEEEFLKSIIPKFKEYKNSQQYLFFIKDDEILDLDDFSYTENNEIIPQITVNHKKEKYLGKKSFLIDNDSSYDFYYKDKKFLNLEPRQYEFNHCGVNGTNDYIFLRYNDSPMKIIPNSFKCEFNGNFIDKKNVYGKECFEITDIGEYIIYRNSKVYDRFTTTMVRICYHNTDYDEVKNFVISYI
ncbi:15110_t:CDS:1 [Cetraspora pellucida]|uniref:15110_t:CDS:1 n=1 Tax=Cetraspora pellucida TaxID=1433469 RepID=A0ACA9LRK6_9GLOM|nr:15110_t:CDS:1 [Cetraspora pellucida]